MGQQERRWPQGKVRGPYTQRSVRGRIEALFLDNIGHIVTRGMIIEVAGTNPRTGQPVENWHQRLSELRTDKGYTILSYRDNPALSVSEYVLPNADQRVDAARRVSPTPETWARVLRRADGCCEWNEDGQDCGLRGGDLDPIGGGTVKLTPDHLTPHSVQPGADPDDPSKWRALCGRHQVMKKNFWDNATGRLNLRAIIQAASRAEKRAIYELLKGYFGHSDAPRPRK